MLKLYPSIDFVTSAVCSITVTLTAASVVLIACVAVTAVAVGTLTVRIITIINSHDAPVTVVLKDTIVTDLCHFIYLPNSAI